MTRSFAGEVVQEVERLAERLVPLMDEMGLQWEHALFHPAMELRDKLLEFEAHLIEKAK